MTCSGMDHEPLNWGLPRRLLAEAWVCCVVEPVSVPFHSRRGQQWGTPPGCRPDPKPLILNPESYTLDPL